MSSNELKKVRELQNLHINGLFIVFIIKPLIFQFENSRSELFKSQQKYKSNQYMSAKNQTIWDDSREDLNRYIKLNILYSWTQLLGNFFNSRVNFHNMLT